MRPCLGLVAAVALSGCQLDAEVRVADDGLRPSFVVTYDGGKSACVQGLTVTDLTGGTRRNVWAIRRLNARDAASCVDTVSFGATPPGYEVAVAGTRLVAGRTYEVSASEAGWQARAPLAVRGG